MSDAITISLICFFFLIHIQEFSNLLLDLSLPFSQQAADSFHDRYIRVPGRQSVSDDGRILV